MASSAHCGRSCRAADTVRICAARLNSWVTDFFVSFFLTPSSPSNWHNFHSHHLTRTYKHAHALNAWAIKGHAGWVLLCCSDCYSERQRPRV